jgi:hypothetical protein
VVLPSGGAPTNPISSTLNPQVDGSAAAGVPNLMPDITTKIAFDTNPSGRNLHVEAGAIMTSVQFSVPRPGVVGAFDKESDIGGGLLGGIGYSVTKKFRVLAHGMYGPGVGRYFIGFGPQFVVVPIAVSPTTFTATPSPVHAGAGFGGVEWQAASKTQIGAYYGGFYFQRNAFPDITLPTLPIIGFGGIGSGGNNNRSIQEGEFVLAQTLWKNPQYGALVLTSDNSYTTRAPWFHAATAPKNAHMFMSRLDLKYVIP